MNDPWQAIREHNAQLRQSQSSRLQQVSDAQDLKKKEFEYQQAIREQARRELEQRQAEARRIVAQQATDRKAHNEASRNALLTQSAQDLRIAHQRSHDARLVAKQNLQERQQVVRNGSPIETAFFEAWCVAYPDITLIRQHQVLKYRLDFAHLDTKIAIELDGHSFHSSRKDRNKDYKRQREIETFGWSFVRFTGSEIFQDVGSCVEIVAKRIKEHMAR
ncbi:MAG TPA: DUF559 domain-containing protein [Ktedonobacteraceae bacterium]|jgi:very-short-patch-repair endonuclease|nr:DUF559 domain-containing protein [Ktedonobacteraceae bacterium]